MKADKGQVTTLLKTARGQLDGLLRMVEDDRYCLDISNQLLATQSILKKVNRMIIEAHMAHCMKDAIGTEDADDKLGEMMILFDKMAK